MVCVDAWSVKPCAASPDVARLRAGPSGEAALLLALKSKVRQATDLVPSLDPSLFGRIPSQLWLADAAAIDALTVSQFVAAYGVTNDVVRSIAIERDNPRPGNPRQMVTPAHSKTFGLRRQVMNRSEATSALGWCGAAVAAVVLLVG
jgi:hypothetical protein